MLTTDFRADWGRCNKTPEIIKNKQFQQMTSFYLLLQPLMETVYVISTWLIPMGLFHPHVTITSCLHVIGWIALEGKTKRFCVAKQ